MAAVGVGAVPGGRQGSLAVTRREAEVLALVANRRTNAEIAAALFVSERTVESHVSALLRKLGAANRRELGEVAAAAPVGAAAGALPGPLALTAEAGPLVGRDGELAQLRELWGLAVGGRTMAALVTGEAGVGKSRLAAELAVEAHRGGAAVLLGACTEGAAVPYQPLADAVAGDLAGLDPADAARRTEGFPALDALLRGPAGGAPVCDPGRDGRELDHALAGYLARAGGRRPVLLVVEDAHWATATTRDALRSLLGAGRSVARLLVVATCRDTSPDLDGDTLALLGDLLRSPSVRHLPLAGLDPAAVAALAAAIGAAGADEGALAADTGGNPLFVREVLAAAGRSARTAGPGALPSVAALVADRAARLSPEDLELLDLAAVCGPEGDCRLLAAAAGVSVAEAVEGLERCEAAGLVWTVPGRPGRWAFVHPVFHRARYEAVPASRRMHLHRCLADALAARGGSDAGAAAAAEVARHAHACHPLGRARAAVAACRHAGDLAAAVCAVDEAAHHFRNALDAAGALDPDDPALRCALTVRLGAVLHNGGRGEGAAVLVEAAAEARRLGDGAALGEVAWAWSYWGSGLPGMASDALVALLDDGLALVAPDDHAARARLLGLRASQHAFAGDTARARAMSDWALGLARAVGDPVVVSQVLMTRRLAVFTPATLDLRLDTAAEMLVLGDRLGLRAASLLGRLGLASCRREQGDLVASFRALDEVDLLLGATPPVWIALLAAAMRANRLLLAGDLDGSERAVADLLALDVGAGTGPAAWADPVTWAQPHRLAISHWRGRLGELDEEVATYAALGSAAEAVRACALAHAGRGEAARAVLDDLAGDDFGELPDDLTWLSAMAYLAEASDVAAHPDAAAAVGARLAPFAGRLDNYGDGSLASIDLALAQAALAAGDGDRAGAMAGAAVVACRRIGAPVLLGRALVCHAAAGAGAAPLDEAFAIAGRTGATVIHHDAARYGLA